MRGDDIRAVGELAGQGLAAGSALIGEMHQGIAGRPFAVLGPAAAPARVLHDGISRAVYAGLRGGLRFAAQGGATLVATGTAGTGRALDDTPAGSLALGTVNGLWGDRLPTLAYDMTVRRGCADVPVTPEGLAAAYPDATGRITVFVHGLFGDDDNWRLFPLRGARAGRRTYGERLRAELGYTPVTLRYNTGRHISHNGRALAALLDELVAAWPEPVEDIVLIGHSMGGLVVRSACHYGGAWTDQVRHVFSLGSPHLGADLEKGINAASWALRRLPETRALSSLLNARSAGIKDLRYGACVDEDWADCEDPDEFLRDRCTEVPFLPGAHYYFIGCTLAEGPVGSVLGDLLVRIPSASGRGNGRGRRIPFADDHGHELSGLTHFDLLNHPAVYAQIRSWLTAPGCGDAPRQL
jgi:pimeloyl-ACP methyl ester carboxylesterase